MKPVIHLIARAGQALHPMATIVLIVLLNVQWTLTIQAFGTQFEQSAGLPVLDLRNVQGVLSPSAAQDLISQYSDADVALYWVFFAMDNVVPLLSFGSFALLWALLLSRSGWIFTRRLAHSWFLLIPFGVGGFDVVENLFFVSALASVDPSEQLLLLTWGLAFVQAKAVMIFATFSLTLVLVALSWSAACASSSARMRGRWLSPRRNPSPTRRRHVRRTDNRDEQCYGIFRGSGE